MKIRITTDYTVKESDYWDWIEVLRSQNVPIDGFKFMAESRLVLKSNYVKTGATTIYEIVREA